MVARADLLRAHLSIPGAYSIEFSAPIRMNSMSGFSSHEIVPPDADGLTTSSEKRSSAAWSTQDDFELAILNRLAASTAKQGKFTCTGTMANLEDCNIALEGLW